MTADVALRLGRALAHRFKGAGNGSRPRVVIGKDTRLSGYIFEQALAAGVCSMGADVWLCGPLPTPGIAFITKSMRADAGVVISASHNPFYDNGIKIFGADGYKLADQRELEIEQLIDGDMTCVEPDQFGKAQRIEDARGRYVEFCKSTYRGEPLGRLKVVLDCANGAAYQVAPLILEELGANLSRIGASPDGVNINLDCGSTSPQALIDTVLAEGADLGIGLDGDADRCLLVDAQGRKVDGDAILYILALARQARGELSGPVVGTLMSNFGLEQALAGAGIEFERTAVGDRYVLERMRETGAVIGGEPSGHILVRDRAQTGDGMVAALQVLSEMSLQQRSLSELCAGLEFMPQILLNVPCGDHSAKSLMQHTAVQSAVGDAEGQLAGSGRLLLRPSGTEPLIRVMAEAESEELARACADTVANAVRQAAQA